LLRYLLTITAQQSTMESDMSNENERNGRPLEQQTKDGSSSAATLGTGSTGDIAQQTQGGNSQAAGRTIDLLSSGSEQEDAGYLHGGTADLQTGLTGIGSLSGAQEGQRKDKKQPR
jgi:hypothetical protein